MKVILSGHLGNLGQHIQKNADFPIHPIGRDNWKSINGLDDQNINAFIHCAYDLKKNIVEFPDEILDSNLLSTMKALRLCKKLSIPRFIFLSSCSVYGHSSRSHETVECQPVTINGLTKYLNEKIILEFCLKNNIQPLILRAFNSYGGDDHFSVVSKMINSANHKIAFTLYNQGLAERDFVHVNDIAKVVCHYALHPSKYHIVNVGTGKTTRIVDVINKIQEVIGKVEIRHQQSNQEVEYSRADISRLREEVSVSFTNILDYLENLRTIST